jgi:hypothetical protein
MAHKHEAEKKLWRQAELSAARAALPLSDDALRSLFESVHRGLEQSRCDNTLKLTDAWIASRGLDRGPIVAWLEHQGGCCDCELGNAAEHWQETLARPAPGPLPGRREKRAPLAPSPTLFEDAVLSLPLPGKPWKIQRPASPGALLELRFGDARVRLLDSGDRCDEASWCRNRAITLIKDSLDLSADDADAYWTKYAMNVSDPRAHTQGAMSGRVYRAGSASRTHFFLWWIVDLPGGARVVEVESEMRRGEGDWREANKMLVRAVPKTG